MYVHVAAVYILYECFHTKQVIDVMIALYAADQPEDNCPREQRAEQKLLQQQRPERVCSRGASQDQDGTKSA